ncbi:MAG: heavy metal-associated domain-containing protein [Thermodesulfovibrionales bacterium]|nr:heavy-metal-associated domain-containing protein [Thermodesulfovibrionales bacterium]MDP3049044.1 heavy metal-associated domain-containing protein [Thermodesulfovibrionales bacterium]
MANTKEINLQAEGISCTGCAIDMETVLRNTNGILKAAVNYMTGIINIEYDPDEIDGEQIFAIIRKMGFRTKIL